VSNKTSSLLVIAGGFVVALSSLLPWISWTVAVNTVNQTAWQLGRHFEDGLIVLIVGLVIVMIGIAHLASSLLEGSATEFTVAFLVTCLAGLTISYASLSRLANLHGAAANWNAGLGYWLCLSGIVIALIGAVSWRRSEAHNAPQMAHSIS
jgi:hypothetical protein